MQARMALGVREPNAVGRAGRIERRVAPAAAAALRAYVPALRLRLEELARISPRHGDLLSTFPAAAVAIATDFGSPAARGEAIWQVHRGAGLSEVAAALDLPFWMRRLGPEFFDGPLPDHVSTQAEDASFGRKLLGLAPDGLADRAGWLRGALDFRRLADDAVALWAARSDLHRCGGAVVGAAPLLACYAWASRRGEGVIRDAVERPWSPRISLRRAAAEAMRWYRRLLAECHAPLVPDEAAAAADWRAPHRIGRYEVRPILEAAELRQEALALRNCLRQYENHVLAERTLLFVVKYAGVSVAALELTPFAVGRGGPQIAQFKGVANAAVSRSVRSVVARWMASRPPFPARLLQQHAVGAVDPERWAAAWAGYAAAKGGRVPAPTPREGLAWLAAGVHLRAALEQRGT